jgi:hypothetical protein
MELIDDDDVVPLREFVGGGAVAGVLEPERSQLNGDRFGAGGGGSGGWEMGCCVGRKGDESFLLGGGGFAGGGRGLAEVLENLFAIDSTNEVAG